MSDNPTDFIWANRFKLLQQNLGDEAFRRDLLNHWLANPSHTIPPTTPAEVQVRAFQMAIGRALLDYPDLDRPSIKARLAALA